MKRRVASFLIALGVAGALLAAQKERALPKDLPPYGPLVAVRAPQIRVETLDNGMTLWLVPRPGFPKVAFAVAVAGGMAADPDTLPGLSDLLADTVNQGTKRRNARQIAEEFQAAGGDFTASARADALLFSTSVLASRAQAALAALADVMQNATFPEEEVSLARRNASDALRAQEARPSFLASRALARAVFGKHPYAVVSATQESIAKTSAAELRRQYHRRFRPDQTLLVAVGDFDAQTMMRAARRLFSGWAKPSEPPLSPVQEPSHTNPHEILLIERPGSVQTTFALGAFGPTERDPDFAAGEVANAIYGGMFGSRLINNIREDRGYTYSPGAFVQTRRQAGLFQTRADVRNAVTGAAFNEIDYELNRMATTAPTQEEITRARRYLVGLNAIRLQSQGSVARQLATLWTYGLPPEELGRESEKIQKVTAREVEAAGARYLPAAQQTIVAVGEEKLIRDQLAPFGIEIKTAKP
jgi:zinc protease